ncbi:hypothetical protein DPSP01_012583 [Paraphaeosphaeria sporulosa]
MGIAALQCWTDSVLLFALLHPVVETGHCFRTLLNYLRKHERRNDVVQRVQLRCVRDERLPEVGHQFREFVATLLHKRGVLLVSYLVSPISSTKSRLLYSNQ